MKRQVLFVDDDPAILEGLRNRLRRQRSKWEMIFVGSGREALQVLESRPIDVIVSDMRMPEMDGSELLRRVQEKHPEAARIVLSGHAELESTLRAVPVAHQFLTKPCEAGLLEGVVERACGLQALLSDQKVRSVIGKIKTLPPVPKVYAQLTAALADEKTSGEEVSRILKQDMAICAKLLQLVNSAFFRLARTITQVEDAVRYLGFNSIKHVVLAAEVFLCSSEKTPSISLEDLQTHAMMVGDLASRFFTDKKLKEDAFVVGLLHDIGKLVLVVELPEHVEKVIEEMEDRGCPMHAAETALSGVTHAELGGYLLGLWGLPYSLIEAVANHHAPTRVDSKEFGLLAAVHIANGLLHESAAGEEEGSEPADVLDLAYLDSLGLDGKISDWRKLAKEAVSGNDKAVRR